MCMVSFLFRLGETCSHIAAALFKVEIGVRLGLTSLSSTSEACKWNRTFRKKVRACILFLYKIKIQMAGYFRVAETNIDAQCQLTVYKSNNYEHKWYQGMKIPDCIFRWNQIPLKRRWICLRVLLKVLARPRTQADLILFPLVTTVQCKGNLSRCLPVLNYSKAWQWRHWYRIRRWNCKIIASIACFIVQFQMNVLQVQYCDFVVCTDVSKHRQRGFFDKSFSFSNLVSTSELVFFNHVLPEIVTRHIYSKQEELAGSEVWCICQKKAYGKMIVQETAAK